MAKEKVILAYSGGLDTTTIIPWLKENYDFDVICVCIDCGQEEELSGLQERAKYCGASKLYILDVIDEFCDEYIVPCVQAHAVYENKYLLGTSMARPLIAKKLIAEDIEPRSILNVDYNGENLVVTAEPEVSVS